MKRIPPAGKYFRFSLIQWAGWFMVSFMGFFTSNPGLTTLSILFLPYFISMLWRKGEPAVLLFVIIFQWLAVCTKVFHADFLNTKVQAMFGGQEVLVIQDIRYMKFFFGPRTDE